MIRLLTERTGLPSCLALPCVYARRVRVHVHMCQRMRLALGESNDDLYLLTQEGVYAQGGQADRQSGVRARLILPTSTHYSSDDASVNSHVRTGITPY